MLFASSSHRLLKYRAFLLVVIGGICSGCMLGPRWIGDGEGAQVIDGERALAAIGSAATESRPSLAAEAAEREAFVRAHEIYDRYVQALSLHYRASLSATGTAPDPLLEQILLSAQSEFRLHGTHADDQGNHLALARIWLTRVDRRIDADLDLSDSTKKAYRRASQRAFNDMGPAIINTAPAHDEDRR